MHQNFYPTGEDHEAIKKYKIIGMGYRNNAICPNCFSKDRERLVYLFLQKLLKQNIINLHSKIIHFSPESSLEKISLEKILPSTLQLTLYLKNVM